MGNMIVSPSAVKNIDNKVGDPSSASAVTGSDAFSKINTLNNKLTDLFQIKSYTYEYTINAESTIVIYGSDFGFSTPSGYYPVACIAFDTDDQRVYSYLVDVHVVNNPAMKLHNIGTISTSGTAKITILYMQDLRTQ